MDKATVTAVLAEYDRRQRQEAEQNKRLLAHAVFSGALAFLWWDYFSGTSEYPVRLGLLYGVCTYLSLMLCAKALEQIRRIVFK